MKKTASKSIFKILTVIVFLIFTGCREQIIHNLDELDANRVVTSLQDAGIDGEKVIQPDGRWSVSVESSRSQDAFKLLEDKRLIKNTNRRTLAKTSVISSRESQRFEYERSVSQEIEQTLLSLEQILEARVHLNFPVTDPLLGNATAAQNSSGSVLIVANGSRTLTKEDISKLVSGASGIPSERISVLVTEMGPSEARPIKISSVSATGIKNYVSSVGVIPSIISILAIIGCMLIFCISVLKKKRFTQLQSEFEMERS